MAAQSYKEKLLPQTGEDKAAYLQRIEQSLAGSGIDSKDRAMLLASKAVATAWNRLEGMSNPFTVAPAEDPVTMREILETTVVLMAKGISNIIPKLEELQNPKQQVADAMHKLGARGKGAGQIKGKVMAQARAAYDRTVLEVLSNVNAVFRDLMNPELLPENGVESQEKAVLEALQPIYEDFRGIRRNLLEARKK